ncbi:MAG: hypothetical protein K2K15_03200, partial [Anaeroplasmataceae bacterium]|nr:hypothetical protein [Anaeroplasmataceae bacterium]
SNTSILVSDDIKKESVTFSITNGQVVSCQRAYGTEIDSYSKVQISYENNKTKLTQNNETRVIYFAPNDSFSFEVDSNWNLVKTEWDTNLKKPTFTSDVLSCKNEIYPIDPSSFSPNGQISVAPSNLTDSDVDRFLYDLYRFTGTGTLRYTLTTSACEIDDVISVITWGVQLNSGTVEVSLFGDVSQRKTKFHKTATDGKYEPLILGAKVTKNTPTITIELNLTNADIVLSEFDIYKQNAGTYYSYDEEGNLIYTESGINGIERNYNEDGTLAGQEAVRAYRYEYDDKKYLIKSISNYGVETNNTYNGDGAMIRQVQVVSNKTSATSRVFETRQTVSTNKHHINSVTNENNDTTYFTYDALERLSTITDALGYTTKYEYLNTDELQRILVENEKIAEYSYDSR